ncbi:unnamed protein product [Vitrella brassicaformis CCMP3155]|uniref:Uncharacterized protein n=1 Tax=Vitrella brassicaformis (strain CCMP3155) TaxID=1169540 RepID=A0A0G4GWP4_VITBC|nr:unnamed protein product [Vitrella brassicaformis CCMP3155]|eukprot:CEM35382.1 unnamed protein product [Vitrella brassicaformis CCMP3155]
MSAPSGASSSELLGLFITSFLLLRGAAGQSAASPNCPCLDQPLVAAALAPFSKDGGYEYQTYRYPVRSDAPTWCHDEWCWIDDNDCTLPLKYQSAYFPSSGLHFSYQTCGSTNGSGQEKGNLSRSLQSTAVRHTDPEEDSEGDNETSTDPVAAALSGVFSFLCWGGLCAGGFIWYKRRQERNRPPKVVTSPMMQAPHHPQFPVQPAAQQYGAPGVIVMQQPPLQPVPVQQPMVVTTFQPQPQPQPQLIVQVGEPQAQSPQETPRPMQNDAANVSQPPAYDTSQPPKYSISGHP